MQFSPRVCVVEEAVLVEVEASARLFGGQRALLARIRGECGGMAVPRLAAAPTALAALALLRQLALTKAPVEAGEGAAAAACCTARALAATLDRLPLEALSATRDPLATLRRLGCQTLGQLRRLPRGGLSRRFGAALLDGLDRAYGLRAETYPWIELPERFSVRLEFSGRIERAEGLMFGAQRLLGQLKAWLQARHCGVTALALHWEHDLVRRSEAPQGQLEVRTAEATRDMAHLAKLLAEHLARTALAAPVVAIRLEARGVEALPTASASLLPEDRQQGESLLQLIERLSARLGPERVLQGQACADHRPQRMQRWWPAAGATAGPAKAPPLPGGKGLHPPWLLDPPLRLAVVQHRPVYQGRLVLLAGPERLEAGWWGEQAQGDALTLRDYFVAQSEHAGLLWVYRERGRPEPGWFLHGIYG